MIALEPAALVAQIARLMRRAAPSTKVVFEVRRQVLARQAQLRLRDRAAPECVVESFFRCLVIGDLQRRHRLSLNELPYSINSSHTASRGVCWAPSRHGHRQILDAGWAEGWRRFQREHPEVNVRVPGRKSARRADLYLATRDGVVSVEFKYAGPHGVGDVRGCAAQMARYVDKHAATLMVIYDGANNGDVRGADRLCSLLGSAVPVIVVSGPSIPAR